MKANEFIIAPENAGKSIVEIMQLYSDQKNKEMWEEIGAANSAIYSLQTNLTSATNELDRWKSKYEAIATGAEIEIQRLTKEVEELKLKLSGKTFFNPFEQENTRLRELLGEIKKAIVEDAIHWDTSVANQFLTKISNALNHKP